MNRTLLQTILKLGVPERIRLVQAIWDSIQEIPSALELSEEQCFELDKRLAQLEANPSMGLEWTDVVKDLRVTR